MNETLPMALLINNTPIQSPSAAFFADVSSKFSSDFMTRENDELQTYGRDWTRVFPARPSAVVFPRTTEEVAQFLQLCSHHRVAVVPSGGRTGLAGGAVASAGEVVLSLSRMNHLGTVDTLAYTVRVQSGAVTEAVHHHCSAYGLTWPVDFASKGSSQIGGNISTNAGGVKVIRYGLTRNWVLGLQVVTMQGRILELNGALEKNNTGVDLRQIFIGSEGTLGIITEATLKLARMPGNLNVFFFAVESISAVLRLFHEARMAPFQMMAFEFLTDHCLNLVTEVRGIKSPFADSHSAYVLLEVENPASGGAQDSLDAWLAHLFENELVLDGVLAQSPREAKELWSLREGISESLSHRGFVHKNDIALPISNLEKFISEMVPLFSKREVPMALYLFGHMGDGNLHVNTMIPQGMSQDQFGAICEKVDAELFSLVRKYQGSISAEHGIGLLKKKALQFSRSQQELDFMRSMKRVFDPDGLLNPGKVFD